MRILETSWLGRVPYAPALALQEERVAAVKAGGPDALFLLEHPPVVTLGRNADRGNIVAPAETMERLGIEVHACGRGGDVTYHGPGQLVGYPIVNLAPDRKDVGKYVRNLEEAILRTVAEYGVEGRRFAPHTGVWVGDRKLAAIGVRISRWVTSHGFALNVATDLSHFQTIIPCGIRTHGVVSLAELLASPPSLETIGARVADHLAGLLDRELVGPRAIQPEGVAS